MIFVTKQIGSKSLMRIELVRDFAISSNSLAPLLVILWWWRHNASTIMRNLPLQAHFNNVVRSYRPSTSRRRSSSTLSPQSTRHSLALVQLGRGCVTCGALYWISTSLIIAGLRNTRSSIAMHPARSDTISRLKHMLLHLRRLQMTTACLYSGGAVHS